MTIGIERSEYSQVEGSSLSVCVVLTGVFDSSPEITVTLTSTPGTATGMIT